jgi:hypothetical protein
MKITDKVSDGFIYKWEKNGFVYYVGSSYRTNAKSDLTTEELLRDSEMWHRKQGTAEGFRSDIAKYLPTLKRDEKREKDKNYYEYTLFRKQIQFQSKEFFEDVRPVFVIKPTDMTLEELLKLEGEHIRDLKKIGQCVWNIDCDPLETYKRNQKRRKK